MTKKKDIVNKIIAIVNNDKCKLKEEMVGLNEVEEQLSMINEFFPDKFEVDDLKLISEEEFNSLIEHVYKEDEEDSINILKAVYYIVNNDIPLFDLQFSKLNEFVSRFDKLRSELKVSNERFVFLDGKIKEYEELEKELSEVKREGIFDISLADKVSSVLNMKDAEKTDFLFDVLDFNLNSYNSLVLSVSSKDEVSIIGDEDVSKKETSIIDIKDLRDLFSEYGYDLSVFDDDDIKKLQQQGSLENIKGVFSAITENNLNFMRENRKRSLLVKFLLDSSEETINNVCSVFGENYVNANSLASYIRVFFKSNENNDLVVSRKREKETRKNSGDELGNTNVKPKTKKDIYIDGAYDDFLLNLDYLSTNFNVDKKTLLERNSKLLMMNHNTLIKNIEELELYGFDIHRDKFPLSTIGASKIMESADCFIEIGEEGYIKKFPSRLTCTCRDIVKRIYAYKEYGFDYHSELHAGTIKVELTDLSKDCELLQTTIDKIAPKDVDKLLNNNKSKELLDIHLPRKISDNTLNDPIILNLDERFKVSDSKYIIDGIIISRKKVLRNYEFLINNIPLIPDEEKNKDDILLVSVINNSLLNKEQIDVIDRNLKEVLEYSGGQNGISKK